MPEAVEVGAGLFGAEQLLRGHLARAASLGAVQEAAEQEQGQEPCCRG